MTARSSRQPDAVRLRPYQCEVARAILTSVAEGRGRTITVEIARQGGKNELSAQLELLLLCLHAHRAAEAVKCAPTFRPQLRISMLRLWRRIGEAGLLRAARREPNAISVGAARLLFLSAETGASVVGHTAGLLLEVDEAQDVAPDKFDRDFRPMTATTNATVVMYGTAWDESSLLERTKQANLEAERRDGVRRHFAYDWQAVAAAVPAYRDHVEEQRQLLGENHPIFLTQYCLQPLGAAGRLFSASQRAQLAGAHERLAQPRPGEDYVGGLDIAGGDDDTVVSPMRDATVLTIGRLAYPAPDVLVQEPRVEIVEHIAWTGEPHETLLPRLIDLLRDVWRVRRVAVDATGIGETAARLLAQALGTARVEAVRFTQPAKSQLGFDLLAAVNGGRLKAYRADGSPEHREFSRQAELARVTFRANETMSFYVEPAEGHDDYVMSAALLVRASLSQRPRRASGRVRSL
jgi:hypothetical protein